MESVWDAASLGMGAVSLYHNVKEGNWGWAALDVVGVVADTVALALPVIPGGAGAAIKASRAAKMGIDALQTTDQAINVGQGVAQATVEYQQGNTGWAAFYGGMSALGARSATTKGKGLARDVQNLSEAEKAGVKIESHGGDSAVARPNDSPEPIAEPLDNAVTPQLGPRPNPRHQAQTHDVEELDALLLRLSERAVRHGDAARRSGMPGREAGAFAETVLERYATAVNNRLSRHSSPYVVEWQPATLPGYGRVSPLVEYSGGRLEAFPDSLRLDMSLSDTRRLTTTPEISRDVYPTIERGYDITLDQSKIDAALKYEGPFDAKVWDIRPEQP